MEMMIKNLLM